MRRSNIVWHVLFALILTRCLALARADGKDETSNEQSKEQTTISTSPPTSSSITTVSESAMHHESNVTTRRMEELNFNDGDGDTDGDTSYENRTVSREIDNRRSMSVPPSKDEIVQQGFSNVTHKLEEIECMFSAVSFVSGTVYLGHQIARFAKYVYHKFSDSDPVVE